MSKTLPLTKRDFELVRFPNGEFKIILKKNLTGEITWLTFETFANGDNFKNPSEELVGFIQLNAIAGKYQAKEVKYTTKNGKLYSRIENKKQIVKTDFIPWLRQDKAKLIGEVQMDCVYKSFTNLDIKTRLPHNVEEPDAGTTHLFRSAMEGTAYDDVVVFPDYGSTKRFDLSILTNPLPGFVGKIDTITFNKVRNAETGELEFTKFEELDTYVKNKKCFIVDDIGTYFGTFKHVAKELKSAGAKEVVLIINHNDNVVDIYKEVLGDIDKVVVLNGGYKIDRYDIQHLKDEQELDKLVKKGKVK